MSSCTGHDPITVAGSVTCHACKGRAYPADAEWITDRLILAAYGPVQGDPGCPGYHDARVVLVDLDAADAAIAPAPAGNAARAAEYYSREVVFCRARTDTGTLCGFRAKGDGLCGTHLAQRARRARLSGGRP